MRIHTRLIILLATWERKITYMVKDNLKSIREEKDRWYSLDNAAKLFPAIESERRTTLFRLSVTLVELVDPELLHTALLRIINRFPYYKVRLGQGLFWYYIENNPDQPIVQSDEHYPCTQLDLEKNHEYLFRVRFYRRRIAVEFCHVLTDGTGAMIFLKTLVREYLRLQGEDIPVEAGILALDQNPHPEEAEDAYRRFYQSTVPHPQKESPAYHLPGNIEKKGVFHIITGIIALPSILTVAKRFRLTLTEFLAAVYIDVLQEIQASHVNASKIKPIRLSVPVNLRKLFASKTMRNFSLYVTPGIDPRLGTYSFEEIVKAVYHHMRTEVNEKEISRHISRNVGGEKNFLVKIVPIWIKKLFTLYLYKSMGENLYSGSLSNLGRVQFPEQMEKHIKRVDFIPGPNLINKSGCSLVSYRDALHISFGRVIKEAELERLFFKRLIGLGIKVTIESNQ